MCPTDETQFLVRMRVQNETLGFSNTEHCGDFQGVVRRVDK